MAFIPHGPARLTARLRSHSSRPDPRRGFLAAGMVAVIVFLTLHLAVFRQVPVALWGPGFGALLGGLWLVGALLPGRYPHGTFGACNAATLLRGALAAALLTPFLAAAPQQWPVFAIAAAAVTLDGLDGWLARRSGLASRFGARFDMEADSVLALVLALNALAAGLAWPLALVLGGTRYVFAGAGLMLSWLARPLPERFGRKAVCVVQMTVLVALLAPPVHGWPATWLAAAAATAVLGSFARDIGWLWSRRA